jgi:hypothetical protein
MDLIFRGCEYCDDTGCLENPTRYTVINDNIFGGSGSWSVGIGPQNNHYDERISDIILEKNRFLAGFGKLHTRTVLVELHTWARDLTVRNNVFDGTDGGNIYQAINVVRWGIEPPPLRVSILNNTIYKTDGDNDGSWTEYGGVYIGPAASETIVKNNLITFATWGSRTRPVYDLGLATVESNNLSLDIPDLEDPENVIWLERDYSLKVTSPAIDAGISVPVFDDFRYDPRPYNSGSYDVGAFEYSPLYNR